jgi:hypothetical protein
MKEYIVSSVGGEPSHHHGGYLQRSLPVGFLNSKDTRLCKRYTCHVLKGAEGARGLHTKGRMDQWHEGLHYQAGGN